MISVREVEAARAGRASPDAATPRFEHRRRGRRALSLHDLGSISEARAELRAGSPSPQRSVTPPAGGGKRRLVRWSPAMTTPEPEHWPLITTLNLAENSLAQLPESLGELSGLKELFLSGNRLEALPAALERLQGLRVLRVNHNRLRGLPPALCGLGALELLHCRGNRIVVLPPGIGRLHSLLELDVSENCLVALPDSVGFLHRLRKLLVSGNRLTALPRSIGGLSSLEKLAAAQNLLRRLPAELGLLGRLRVVSLQGNLALQPQSLARAGAPAKAVASCAARLHHVRWSFRAHRFLGPLCGRLLTCVLLCAHRRATRDGGADWPHVPTEVWGLVFRHLTSASFAPALAAP